MEKIGDRIYETDIERLSRKEKLSAKTAYDMARKHRVPVVDFVCDVKQRALALTEMREWDANTETTAEIAGKLVSSLSVLESELKLSPKSKIEIRKDLWYSGMFNEFRRICSSLDVDDTVAEDGYAILAFLFSVWTPERKEFKKTMRFVIERLKSKSEIVFFTANSKSISRDSKELRQKPQYHSNEWLRMEFEKIKTSAPHLPVSYLCVLPDFDPSLVLDDFSELWERNLDQIRKYTNAQCVRLSKIANFDTINYEAVRKELEDDVRIFSEKQASMIEFEADANFSERQIISYAIVGQLLEKSLPNGILLDIQKRHYPFEQPFYSRLRNEKLPIFYCWQRFWAPI